MQNITLSSLGISVRSLTVMAGNTSEYSVHSTKEHLRRKVSEASQKIVPFDSSLRKSHFYIYQKDTSDPLPPLKTAG